MRFRLSTVVTSIVFLALAAGKPAAAGGEPGLLRFEPNRGQVDAHWEFVARTGDGRLLLGERELRLGTTSMTLPGADLDARWEAIEPLAGRAHYLLGDDPQGWILDVPSSAAVLRRHVYPGIDIVVRGSAPHVILDFVVAPDADPAAIALELEDGRWRLSPPIVDGAPASFRASGKALRIDVSSASRTAPLHV